MRTKKDIRDAWKADIRNGEKALETLKERIKKHNALLELVPEEIARYLNPYFNHKLSFWCPGKEGLEAVAYWRRTLREAFGSWNDEVVLVQPGPTRVSVTYRSKELPVEFDVMFPREDFEASGILSEDCQIKEQVRTDYTVVCNS